MRISVTDGLATLLISANLPKLFKKIPNLRIDLQCSVAPLDVIRFETDLSIRFKRPVQSRIVAAKLGTLHFLPFASTKYLEEYGTPNNLEDIQNHNILDHESYFDDDGDWSDWKRLLGDTHRIVYRTNSSMAMLEAIEQGVGIGLLPTYVSAITKAEMLNIGFQPMEKPEFMFSDHEYVEIESWLDPHPNPVSMDDEPLMTIRPEGSWDVTGVLDQSAQRGATNPL